MIQGVQNELLKTETLKEIKQTVNKNIIDIKSSKIIILILLLPLEKTTHSKTKSWPMNNTINNFNKKINTNIPNVSLIKELNNELNFIILFSFWQK